MGSALVKAIAAAQYAEELRGVANVTLPPDAIVNGKVSWFVYVVRVENRDALARSLAARGIGCGKYFAPLHRQPLFAPYCNPGDDFSVHGKSFRANSGAAVFHPHRPPIRSPTSAAPFKSAGRTCFSGGPPCGRSLAPVTTARGSKQAEFPVNNSESMAWPVLSSMWLLESLSRRAQLALWPENRISLY